MNEMKFIGKRAGRAEIVGFIIMLVLLATVVIGTFTILSESRYAGDAVTVKYYDLKSCDIRNIPREQIRYFKDLDEAIQNGYTKAPC